MRAKKSLGQNFLKSGVALTAIVDAGEITSTDVVLEVGPGKGALTDRLLQKAGTVIAIEKDSELLPLLSEKFSPYIQEKKLDLREGDILVFDPETLRSHTQSYKVIANIPYYITGAIVRKFLESSFLPERMVLLVQKEVSDRIVARDGKESILSISVKAFGTPKYITKVRAKEFSPAPKVDSAVLSIYSISHKNFPGGSAEIERFFDIVKIGFAHKRKLLSRNLEALFSKVVIEDAFAHIGISPKARAEDVQIDVWLALSKKLSQ